MKFGPFGVYGGIIFLVVLILVIACFPPLFEEGLTGSSASASYSASPSMLDPTKLQFTGFAGWETTIKAVPATLTRGPNGVWISEVTTTNNAPLTGANMVPMLQFAYFNSVGIWDGLSGTPDMGIFGKRFLLYWGAWGINNAKSHPFNNYTAMFAENVKGYPGAIVLYLSFPSFGNPAYFATKIMTAPRPPNTQGNYMLQLVSYVRLEGGNDFINFSQLVITDINGINIAPRGVATSSGAGFWTKDSTAIDGVEASRGHPNEYHSSTNVNAFYQVMLQQPSQVTSVTVYNRADCCEWRMAGFKIVAYDDRMNILFKSSPLTSAAKQVITLPQTLLPPAPIISADTAVFSRNSNEENFTITIYIQMGQPATSYRRITAVYNASNSPGGPSVKQIQPANTSTSGQINTAIVMKSSSLGQWGEQAFTVTIYPGNNPPVTYHLLNIEGLSTL